MKKIRSVDELKAWYYNRKGFYTTSKPSPLPYKPRWLNMLYAYLNAYFWLPCPECGKSFGGHEWYGSVGSLAGGEGVCPECALKNYNDNGDTDRIVI